MVALKRMRSHSKLYSGSSIEKTYSAQNEFVRAIIQQKTKTEILFSRKLPFEKKNHQKSKFSVQFQRESGGDSGHTNATYCILYTVFA